MLRKIPVSDLTLGMYIHEFCRPRINDPFWAANVERELSDAAVLRHIQASTREVWIDTRLGKNSVESSPAERTPPSVLTLPKPRLAASSWNWPVHA